MHEPGNNSAKAASGHLIYRAAGYDFIIWLMTLGREGRLRAAMLDPATLTSGESVLDLGCGTGSLAIRAKHRVGPGGRVAGVDASLPMLERARRKARKAHVAVIFENAIAQSLPFPDATFDVVICSVMLHHLRKQVRPQVVQEARRVLTTNGRLLAIEFGAGVPHQRSLISHMHRHAHIRPDSLAQLMTDAGLRVIRQGAVGMWDLHYAVAGR